MKQWIAVAIVFGFLTTGFITVHASPPSAEGQAQGRPMATADGLYWKDDTRLTDNPVDDILPTLVVDTFGNSFVLWYRGSGMTSGTHYYKKIDRYGNELFQEKDIVSAPMPVQHCGQPCQRIGIDSQESLHVVWTTQGLYGPMYQKFASNGQPLTQPINLAPMAANPHVVNLAVGTNNRAYVAYENEGSERVEMAYVDSNFNLHTGYLSRADSEGITIGLDKKNDPYLFSKAWTGTGMWMTEFSPEGQTLISATKIDTPVSGTGWDAPLPELAFGTDGAIHLLQASRASGVKTLYYTKLAADGTKLTNDIPLTETSNDFGDICVDSKLNVYCIWGDATDGKLYYVRIQPGHENDTLTPVKLTDSAGTDRDPQIAVDPEDSLHVSWTSDRDGNKEVYYKFAFSFGVELTMTPEEMAKVMYLHPNETRTANITVRNMGGQNDTMYLGVGADLYGKDGGFGAGYKGGGWKVWMDDRFKTIDMDAQEVLRVPISVRGPVKGIPNEYITVIASATSKMNPLKNDTVQFRVYLVVDHHILMKCPDHVHTTAASIETQYIISVSNIGDIDETVNLTANGPPGWDFSLNFDEVRLRQGDTTSVDLFVTPPADAQADEVGLVTVTGHSEALWTVKDQVSTHTVVTPYMYIVITSDKPEDFVDPGNSTVFTLTVSNYGNMAGTVMIILEILSGTGDWVTALDTNAVGVAGGEGKNVQLTVAAPVASVAGTRLVVRVQGFDATKRYSADCLVTTIVNQVHRIIVASTPEMIAVYPSEKASFQMSLSNLGNGPEDVRLGTADVPVGWDIAYQRPDSSVIEGLQALYLDPGGAISLNAIVTTAAGSLAMDYMVKGMVIDHDGNIYPISLVVRMNQVFDIDITTTQSKQTGVPGGKVLFTLIGKNKGNGFDTLTFTQSGLPASWQDSEFQDASSERTSELSLNASALERMSLVVPIPGGTNGTSVEFYVTATSLGGGSDSVKLVIDIKMANLLISKVTYAPKDLKAGKLATIVITLENVGEVSVENVTVRFYQDSSIMANDKLEMVTGGTNRTVTFTWMAKGGDHTLKFVVDPDNMVVESNKKDNMAKQSVRVQAPGFLEMPGFGAPLLLLAMALGATVMVFYGRKR